MKKFVSSLLLLTVVFTLSMSSSYASGASNWAKPLVDKAVGQGVVHEDLSKNYQEEITRAEFCKLLVHLYVKETGINDVKKFMNTTLKQSLKEYRYPFKDIDYNDADADYIIIANILGFTGGTSDSTFSPNAKLTREQAAKIMYVVLKKIDADGGLIIDDNKYKWVSNKFSDDKDISSWAKDDVYRIRNLGIMSGVVAIALALKRYIQENRLL